MNTAPKKLRCRVLILGDQLDRASSAFDDFDPSRDSVWMAEVAEESTHVWSSRMRIAVFLSGMRHFAAELRARGVPLEYQALDGPGPEAATLADALRKDHDERPSERLIVTEPGDYRVLQSLRDTARSLGVPLEVRPDRHFMCSTSTCLLYTSDAADE